ncbi:coproporphyrinogen dehydrogenase HemZ [Clostridium sp. AM58-1XD]|uniref:coproporphyrinogen dehydrogenase HemZ n=1 Tax=Clostridium sp. AM58-1XD TaxID=2292307 RepID=UPI000E4B7BDF|nr:coproporphyrinogen dehydrogenase HemZ [Clostridium sp. AM58-1XD]RGY99123.1 coproporphyrinogen dehydrogenase HemZ [Clostridium sp. AM58-1XD]
MIGLLLNDRSYEQDIRELLMAFYPGETFVYEKNDEAQFYIHGDLVQGDDILAETGDATYGEGIYILSLECKDTKTYRTFEVCYGQRFETKNKIKRGLYDILSKRTERELPWGTLTGIRPTKIAMTKMEEGWKKDDIARYMRDTYLASREKIDLSMEIAERERELLSDVSCNEGYSLYVGIPFCPTTCLYCSFTSFPIGKWEGRTGLYLEALFKEMDYTADKMKGRVLDTVYFGGGTPTSLSAEDLDRILNQVEKTFDLSKVKEYTVEAGRPDSITREKLEVLRKHGITRISINPQTMKQATLDLIGRHHTVDMVKEKFLLARELGFDNINMDLIIGLPEETLEDVKHTMEEVKALQPDSVTVHSLAIKRAARLNMFKEQYQDLKITNTQEMIDLTAEYARNMGMEPYYLYRQKNMAGNFENVGYSLPGKACLYNILIMEEKQTIAACGAGTTTKVTFPSENRLERVENVKDVEQYIGRIDEMLERKGKLLDKMETP